MPNHLPILFSVEVPPEVDYDAVLAVLDEGPEAENWDYETASVRP